MAHGVGHGGPGHDGVTEVVRPFSPRGSGNLALRRRESRARVALPPPSGARPHFVAVDPVVDHRDPVAGLAYVHEAMGDELEPGRIPRRVVVGWPPHVAELDLRDDVSACTSTGRATFSRRSCSCQSTSVSTTRAPELPAAKRKVWTAPTSRSGSARGRPPRRGPGRRRGCSRSGLRILATSGGKKRQCPMPATRWGSPACSCRTLADAPGGMTSRPAAGSNKELM